MATGLLFRYLEAANKMQVFRVLYDDRTIRAECRGTIHEFPINTNECCVDGKYRMKDLLGTFPAKAADGTKQEQVPADVLLNAEHMTIPFHEREWDVPSTEQKKPEIRKEQEKKSEEKKEDDALARLRAIQAKEGD